MHFFQIAYSNFVLPKTLHVVWGLFEPSPPAQLLHLDFQTEKNVFLGTYFVVKQV